MKPLRIPKLNLSKTQQSTKPAAIPATGQSSYRAATMESINEVRIEDMDPVQAVPTARKNLRRPKMPRVDLYKPLSTQLQFHSKSIDTYTSITKVKVDGNTIVVATKNGKILFFDKKTFRCLNTYQEEQEKKEITDFWFATRKAILFCTSNCKIFLKCLEPELDFQQIDYKYGKDNIKGISCVTVLYDKFEFEELNFAIGTLNGQVIIYNASWLLSSDTYWEKP